ncbi:MAG TPA: hypothetical protein VHD56_13680 [Tepidisphaeraceae bacterium]|nr:hypothetical protein [Tepidisphaeraceae bacterium]
MKFASFALAAIGILGISRLATAQSQQLVIHEWGTFTALQDANGNAITNINQDVERLPSFVKSLSPESDAKGLPPVPGITMRLETPVVYFHLPANSGPVRLTLSAEFHGGLLTQYYPDAKLVSVTDPKMMDSHTFGSLTWDNITVGTTVSGPETTSPIWLAPRKVDAANVTATTGQSERYLFYRGVAHIDSPLKVIRRENTLRVAGQSGTRLEDLGAMAEKPVWLVDIRSDGKSAFRKMQVDNPLLCSAPPTSPAEFKPSDYSADRLTALRAEMKTSLVSAGLFEDEAAAMLNTWEQAYFKSPGTRVFFIVPRTWVDQTLPLRVSVPATIERVMVGRIDLVTPKQRELAARFLMTDLRGPISMELGRFGQPIIEEEARLAKVQQQQ